MDVAPSASGGVIMAGYYPTYSPDMTPYQPLTDGGQSTTITSVETMEPINVNWVLDKQAIAALIALSGILIIALIGKGKT